MRYFYLGAVVFLLGSCCKDEDPIINASIDFENLEVGDILLYSYLTGEPHSNEMASGFEYTGDTLELKVLNKIGSKYLISERITPGSAVFSSEQTYMWGTKEDTNSLMWDIREDSIVISSNIDGSPLRSHLFYDTFKFSLEKVTENEVEFKGWYVSSLLSGLGSERFIKDGSLLDITYPHLNVFINNGPMAYDGNGSAYIYSKENGFVRTITYSAWTLEGRGWDRIK